jgi:predicted nucleotidyltransferase component of viral defense system
VRYATGNQFRRALDDHIERIAKQQDVQHVRWRKLVAFERLLTRLLAVAPDRWVVKGGYALNLRFKNRSRTTMDLDLAHADNHAAALEDLISASELDVDDRFVFRINRVDDHDDDHHPGSRFRVTASVGGKAWEELRIDIGFGDVLPMSPEVVPTSGFLSFAGLDPIDIPVISLEQQIAEKLHAYTRTYGKGDQSSRPKDLIDIVLISSECAIGAGHLRHTLKSTFSARDTHVLPAFNLHREIGQSPIANSPRNLGYHQISGTVTVRRRGFSIRYWPATSTTRPSGIPRGRPGVAPDPSAAARQVPPAKMSTSRTSHRPVTG